MSLKMNFFGLSDVGKVRKNNEDSFIVDNDLSLAIVADGMGGHKSGEIASSMAVKITKEKYSQLIDSNMRPTAYNDKYSPQSNMLNFATQMANTMIFETSKAKEDNKGMGTTITACAVNNSKISIVHVGDSRAYLLREKSIYQISQDHSLVMEQYRKGIITKQQAETSPLQNVLTKALGTQNSVEADIIELELRENDRILLCSDGLFKCMDEATINDISNRFKSIEEAVKVLIKIANDAGSPDNVTVVMGEAFKLELKEKLKGMLRKFI